MMSTCPLVNGSNDPGKIARRAIGFSSEDGRANCQFAWVSRKNATKESGQTSQDALPGCAPRKFVLPSRRDFNLKNADGSTAPDNGRRSSIEDWKSRHSFCPLSPDPQSSTPTFDSPAASTPKKVRSE